jgi:membrane-bound ClpP family serine protease
MSLAIAVAIGFIFLESPGRWILIGAALLWEGFEIMLFLKWRGVKATSGHEAMIGMKGRAVTPCRPNGQARIKGQLWSVHCPQGVDIGDYVRVVSLDGMTPMVQPAEPFDN